MTAELQEQPSPMVRWMIGIMVFYLEAMPGN